MKYFRTVEGKDHSWYHEWQKGRFDEEGFFEKWEMGIWDEDTFWKSDSLILSDDVVFELHLGTIFAEVFGHYAPDFDLVVTREHWDAIKQKAFEAGGEVAECILEAEPWVQETFREYDAFTMMGI